MKRPQIVVFILAVVLFTIGAATGALAHRFYVANTVNASEDWRVRYINEMHSRLKLTTQQVDKLNDILDDTRAKVRAVKDSYQALKCCRSSRIRPRKFAPCLRRSNLRNTQSGSTEQEAKAKEQDERDRRSRSSGPLNGTAANEREALRRRANNRAGKRSPLRSGANPDYAVGRLCIRGSFFLRSQFASLWRTSSGIGLRGLRCRSAFAGP